MTRNVRFQIGAKAGDTYVHRVMRVRRKSHQLTKRMPAMCEIRARVLSHEPFPCALDRVALRLGLRLADQVVVDDLEHAVERAIGGAEAVGEMFGLLQRYAVELIEDPLVGLRLRIAQRSDDVE